MIKRKLKMQSDEAVETVDGRAEVRFTEAFEMPPKLYKIGWPLPLGALFLTETVSNEGFSVVCMSGDLKPLDMQFDWIAAA